MSDIQTVFYRIPEDSDITKGIIELEGPPIPKGVKILGRRFDFTDREFGLWVTYEVLEI